MWTSTSEEGWLLPGDAESWQCTQTLEIISSAAPKLEEAFFNQVVALPQAGLFLLANAKRNAIYVVHIEYGPNPAATRMDYIAEFTVTMPILSLTGTCYSLPDGDHLVQVYCVQTQAIQQYALDLSQCLPPPVENVELEKTKSATSYPFDVADVSAPLDVSNKSKPSDMIVGEVSLLPHFSSESSPSASHLVKISSSEITSLPEGSSSGVDCRSIALTSQIGGEEVNPPSPRLPLSPNLLPNLSDFRSLTNGSETSLSCNDQAGDQPGIDHSFKHPTHLVTPSEILSTAATSSEQSQTSQGMNALEAKVQDDVINNDVGSIEVEVKVIGETEACKNDGNDGDRESQNVLAQKKEKAFYSQASGLSFQMAHDYRVETYSVEGIVKASEEAQDMTKDAPSKAGESETPVITSVQATKGKKQKGKNSQVSGPSSSFIPSPFNSTDSPNGPDGSSDVPSAEAALPQLSAMKNTLDQVTFRNIFIL